MDNKDLQAIHDEIWAQIYDTQRRTLEQQSPSTHSDKSTQSPQSHEKESSPESNKNLT